MNNKITFGVGGAVVGLVLATLFTTTLFPNRNGNFDTP